MLIIGRVVGFPYLLVNFEICSDKVVSFITISNSLLPAKNENGRFLMKL